MVVIDGHHHLGVKTSEVMDTMRNSQQKMIMTTIIFLFIISLIEKKTSFAEEQDNLGYQEVSDDDDDDDDGDSYVKEVSDEYRRANYDGDQVQLSRTAQVTWRDFNRKPINNQ